MYKKKKGALVLLTKQGTLKKVTTITIKRRKRLKEKITFKMIQRGVSKVTECDASHRSRQAAHSIQIEEMQKKIRKSNRVVKTTAPGPQKIVDYYSCNFIHASTSPTIIRYKIGFTSFVFEFMFF